MIQIFGKKTKLLVAIFSMLFLWSCQKDIDETYFNSTSQIPNLTTKVNSSVSGFVTDENNAAVIGATVNVGTSTTTTDKYGYFSVKNVDVVKTAAVVTVTKQGYFKGIKTYAAIANKSAFFRIKLIPKTTSGTINATTGGSVTLTNGLIVSLPANAVVNLLSSGQAYTGVVSVTAYWINPTGADVNAVMPGDLRGLTTTGAIKTLQSFGMAAIELTGASGELLQIAPGKKATLTFPIPSSLSATAPANIPLWYFDETIGLWKEDGSAIKTGNTYVGEVSHFSFWNCDVPANYVQFDCTVLDADNNPLPYTIVKISDVNNIYNYRFGYTDSTGYVTGLVPDNAQLKLEVFTFYNCSNAAFSQNFTTTNTGVSLGNIVVLNTALNQANVSGTVTDCSNNPVSNGYIIVLKDNQYFRYALSNTGTYNFVSLLCSGSSSAVTMIAEDAATLQQSAPLSYVFVNGANTVPNIQACGISTDQFFNYTINGTNYSYTSPADTFYMYVNSQMNPPRIEINAQQITSTQNGYGTIGFDQTGIAVGSSQPLSLFYCSQISNDSTSVAAPFNVNITEYGNVGEFISGDFSGTLIGLLTNYTVSGNFRVRRRQ